MTHTILHIDSSARLQGSATRALSSQIVSQLGADRVIRRDLRAALPQITEDWVEANFTPEPDRSPAQAQTLALSDELVREIEQADTLVIGVPIYNFSVPASLKAWIDLVCRAGLTFRFGPDGSEGMLTNKRAVVALAAGGVKMGADNDFASDHIRQVLAFVGITDVEFVAADQMAIDPEASLAAAQSAVAKLAA